MYPQIDENKGPAGFRYDTYCLAICVVLIPVHANDTI